MRLAVLLVWSATTALAQATKPAISEADLRTRAAIIAADSLLGRVKGGRGQFQVAEYIAREFRRLNLDPGGDRGTYFQEIPLAELLVEPTSWLSVRQARARLWEDYFPLHGPSLHVLRVQQAAGATLLDSVYAIDGATVLFAGRVDDTTGYPSDDQIKGRFVLFDAARSKNGARVFEPPERTLAQPRFRHAAAVAIAQLDLISANAFEAFRRPWQTRLAPASGAGPVVVLVTPALAERLLGAPLGSARPGTMGERVAGSIRVVRRPLAYSARNVIAVLRGREATETPSIVMVGGHSDGTGVAARVYDHDSVRLASWNAWFPRLGSDSVGLRAPVFGLEPRRADSIFNGANDNASAVAGLLEIAEAMATSRRRPRRSVVFFSSGAEEGDTDGAQWFLTHSAWPLGRISSYVNMEMVGRGARTPIGQRVKVEVSYSEVPPAALIAHADSANRSLGRLADLTMTGGGCGSDHAPFNASGIPAISFQARGDPDYHQVTDEAQYLNYGHLLAVTRIVWATVERIANAAVAIPRPGRAATADEKC